MLKVATKVEMVIGEFERDEQVNAFELGYFLYFFRSAYVASLELLEGKDIDPEEAAAIVRKDILGAISQELNRLWLKELPPELDLEFIEISKQSPIKTISAVSGICLFALTFAVILSGGKANIYTGSFELPPLAVGIRALKEAFNQAPPPSNALPSERKAILRRLEADRGSNG